MRMDITREQLAQMIDHTQLKSHAKPKKIVELCEEAIQFNFKAVCVNSHYVPLAKKTLEGSNVLVCSVVGFPLGMMLTDAKAFEARRAVEEGADEIDMVLNVGMFKAGEHDYCEADVKAVVEASKPSHVKVILETGYLTDEEIVKACELCVRAGAAFVKTSTGFGAMGSFADHVRLMRQTVGPDIGVKAAGGISNVRDALRMADAGADRLGCSAGIAILEGLNWLKYSKGLLAEDIPCHECPSRAASMGKQPKEVYLYYKKRCQDCEHREHNVFYD
jgi:deoxyribose-phosphate aldolase